MNVENKSFIVIAHKTFPPSVQIQFESYAHCCVNMFYNKSEREMIKFVPSKLKRQFHKEDTSVSYYFIIIC